MTCYVLGCPASPVLSAVHRRYGPVCACRRHYPGPLALPLTARAGWLAAPLAPALAPFQGPGAELWEGPRVAPPVALAPPPPAPVAGPRYTCRVLGCPTPVVHPGALCDRCAGPSTGERQPAPPPPPVRPPQGPALVAPVAPRSPAYPAEALRAPARDASTLIAF